MNDNLPSRILRGDADTFNEEPHGTSERVPHDSEHNETVAGLFDSTAHAVAALEDFVVNGFERNDMTLIANNVSGEYDRYFDDEGHVIAGDKDNTTVGEAATAGGGIGAALGGAGGVLMGLGLLVIPGIGPALAAGPIIAGLVGAGAGAVLGGVAGALVGSGLPKERAEEYAEGVRRGGTLLLVHTEKGEPADLAYRLMNSHDPVDIDARARDWRETGWSGFDPDARPYTRDEVMRERERYPMTGSARSMDDRDKTLF